MTYAKAKARGVLEHPQIPPGHATATRTHYVWTVGSRVLLLHRTNLTVYSCTQLFVVVIVTSLEIYRPPARA